MALITQNPSVDLLINHFRNAGYVFERFELDESSYTRFISPSGATWLTQDAHMSYPFSNATCHQIAAQKELAYELCASSGVRVPYSVTFNNIADQRNALGVLLEQGPVVVKPSSSSLSWGVTLNIRSREALEDAYAEACKFSKTVIAQEQVSGEEIRFAVIDGEVKAALLRQTPRVVGDGEATIANLIERENALRKKISVRYVTYPQLDDRIIDFNALDLVRIPNKNEVVELSRATMIKGGASVFNVLDNVHSSYIDIAEKAARLLSTKFIVVDVMIQDYTKPSNDTNYAFIEFNSSPVLKLFYSCRDGAQFDIVAELAPMIDEAIQGGKHV